MKKKYFILTAAVMVCVLWAAACGIRNVDNADEVIEYKTVDEEEAGEYVIDSENSADFLIDLPPELEVYRRFLAGEEKMYVRDDSLAELCPYYDNDGTRFFIKEFECDMWDVLESVREYYLNPPGWNDKIEGIWYACLDCGNDGSMELAVRFKGIDIYSPSDDSDVTFVLKYDGNRPVLCYAFETWARSETQLYYYGFVENSGSGGASIHYYSADVLDLDGSINTVKDSTFLSGSSAADIAHDEYYEVFDKAPEMTVEVIKIDDERVYRAYISDEADYESCNLFISLCEQKGMIFLTEEEEKNMLEEKINSLGIDEKCLERAELVWKKLDGSMYNEFIRSEQQN